MDKSKEINELEQQLKILKEAQAEYDAYPEDKKLAEELHNLLCRWNHTDGCGWYYHNWDSNLGDRAGWLNKARKLLKKYDFDTIIDIIKIAK